MERNPASSQERPGACGLHRAAAMTIRSWMIGSLMMVALPSAAQAGVRKFNGVAPVTDATPLHSLTPTQQWNAATEVGFNDDLYGMAAFADDMGDKLSEVGRARFLAACFGSYAKEPTNASLEYWPICAADAKALNYEKLKAELKADKQPEDDADLARIVEAAKKHVAFFDQEVPTDSGLQALMKVGEAANAEWKAYIDKNKPAFERYVALKDGVRSKKTNAPAFEKCWQPTFDAFAKYIKATQWPWEMEGDQLPAYMSVVVRDPGSYIAAVSYGACAYSVDPGGEALFVTAAGTQVGTAYAGPRTTTIARLLDPKFVMPKFQDRSRSVSFDGLRRVAMINPAKANAVRAISTSQSGVIGKVTTEGDVAKVTFKGEKIKACLQWKDTNKVQSYASNGDPNYERKCAKMGMVEEDLGTVEVAKAFVGGMAPGRTTMLISKFPVYVYDTKKFVINAMFGIPTK